MDPREYGFRKDDNDLIGKDLKVQLKTLDDYLDDRIYNMYRKRLVGESLQKTIQTWDQQKKLDVIERYITTKPYGLASIIDWFDINDPNKLLDIANRIMDNKGYICGNIEKFHIQDEAMRIEIAKRDIRRMPNMLMKNIDKFNITNQQAILDIARMGFLENEYSFCENFDKFGIQDEQQRIKFAKVLVDVNLGLIPPNIDKFNITSQDMLVEIAKDIAKKSYGNNISRYINNFHIQDEKERINIAKIIAHKSGEMIAPYIKRYMIQDKEAMFEILEEAVITDENCRQIVSKMSNFDIITSTKDINRIFNIILSHDDDSMYMNTKLEKYAKKLTMLDNPKDVIKSTKNLKNIQLLHEYYAKGKREINFDMKSILGEQNKLSLERILELQQEERTKKLSMDIIEKILFVASNVDFTIEDKDGLTRLITDLITIRSLKLKKDLLPLSVKLINDNGMHKISQEIAANNKKKAYPSIYAVLFDKLSLYDEQSKDLLCDIRKVFGSNSFVKDSKVVQSTLISLIKLEKTYLLAQQKKDILSFLVKNSKSIKNNARYLSLIIEFGEIDSLKDVNINSDDNILKDMFYSICEKYLALKEKDDAFIKEYEEFITMPQQEKRNLEECIMTYIAARNDDSEVIDATRKFIETMTDIQRFRDMRYDTAKSEHLLKLKENSNIYQKWISGEYTKDALEGNDAIVTDDPVDLFLLGTEVEGSCQSVFYPGELNSCLMGYVIDGKNKAVVIKNKEGKIMARCIIRLLIEKDSDNPVIIREKLYKATGVDDSVIDTINERCIDYAKWLGVSLVCVDSKSNEKYLGTLVSKGGQAPAEYVDALRQGVLEEEGYEIQSLELAYLYKEGG